MAIKPLKMAVGCSPRKLKCAGKHRDDQDQNDRQQQIADDAVAAAQIDVVGRNVHPKLPTLGFAHDSATQVSVENSSLEAIGRLEADRAVRPNGIRLEKVMLISRRARAIKAAAALAIVSPLQ